MPKTLQLAPFRAAGGLLVAGLVLAVVPSVADASAIKLATVSPFVVLGGSMVTNIGPSVLNGELGVAPGTALTGFGPPAMVSGTTHDDDAVAVQAQQDLTTAYTSAAGQPVPPGNTLTGQDLGNLTLTAGDYRFATSAQLTGKLTLDAGGNSNAQFVFEIGTALTTASASSVVLIGGASPCNVYWQIGSSATLGSTTSFQGNLMAQSSITLNSGSSVEGRVLAENGAVTLSDNAIDNSMCTTSTGTSSGGTSTTTTPGTTTPGTTTTPTSTTPGSMTTPGTTTTPGATSPGSTTTPGTTSTTPGSGTPGPTKPSGTGSTPSHRDGSAKLVSSHSSSLTPCNDGFTVTVSGRKIKRVVFTVNRKLLTTRLRSPFRAHVPPNFRQGDLLRARVTFKDATRPRTLTYRYRACAAVATEPLPAGSTFTG